jgi:adenine-specific DNA-methyltransferase
MRVPRTQLELIDVRKRRELGQFLTPRPVADFMASLFDANRDEIELLDAGAGAGALTAAFVRRLCSERRQVKHISVTAYELDPRLIEPLTQCMEVCAKQCEQVGVSFTASVLNEDFIEAAGRIVRGGFFTPQSTQFNAAIINPPYRKIRGDSQTRLLLHNAGVETGNLYAGFTSLVVRLLGEGGELVAITPRSFCNGPYFKRFRLDLLKSVSLRRLHIFESRSAAFCDDSVLQENIIVHGYKGKTQPPHVIVSSSSGEPQGEVLQRKVSYRDVVSPSDPAQFIHLTLGDEQVISRSAMTRHAGRLIDLGLSVSTGRVVDFRVRAHLRQLPVDNTAPLIYPCHFDGGFVRWPKTDSRKPDSIAKADETSDLLVPSGIYVLVKRFSAKEERRRIVACIYDPGQIAAPLVGFENHLNYFHAHGHGMQMDLAKGLAAFLNSTVVDMYFRQFSGHTQVNATDLRMLNYPARSALEFLGQEIHDPGMPQPQLDHVVKEVLF